MAEGRDDVKKLQTIADRTSDVRPSDDFTDAALDRVTMSSFERIAEATGELAPTGDFVEALMKRVSAEDDPFASIAHRTAFIRPTNDFTDVVMEAIAAPEQSWGDSMMKTARPSLFLAALAAAASIAFSWYTERTVDADLLVQSAEVAE